MSGTEAGVRVALPRRWRVAALEPLPVGFIAVAAAVSALILLLVATVIWLSFTTAVPGVLEAPLTLANYAAVMQDSFAWRVVLNTCIFSASALAVAFGFGLPLAWLAERTDMPGRTAVVSLMTASLVIPNFAVALGWLFLFNQRIGIVNRALILAFGLTQPPFNIASLAGMGMVEGLNLVPVAFVMTAGALKSMDPALEEAAAMAGATGLAIARRVTLPALTPALLGAAIYVFVIGFATFDVPAVIGLSGRIFTFSTYIYTLLEQSVDVPNYGRVGALSVAMIVFGAALGWLYNRQQRESRRYAVISGKAFRPRLAALGRARSAALGFAFLYFAASQGLPLLVLIWTAGLPFLQLPSAAVLGQWSLANFASVLDRRLALSLENTMLLMLLVPTLTLAASLAYSWVVIRSRLKWRALFDFVAFMPHTIPAVVFSVAALFVALFVLQPVVPIYGTLALLVAVYALVRLSYGTRMTNAALVQIHVELEEAAKMAGAAGFATFGRVVVPLMRPVLLYAWIWISLLSYRELTLPVLLATQSNQPLSLLVWSHLQTSDYGPASAITLLMLALLLPVILLYWRLARLAQFASG